MYPIGPYRYGNPAAMGGVVYDPIVTAWSAAVVSAGGAPSAARLAIWSTMWAGIRADGDLSSFDSLWGFCGEDTQSALIDFIGLRTATAVNSPTFTANQGYAGNGTTSYINSTWNPVTHGVAYTQNSAGIILYDRTARTDAANVVNCGIYDLATKIAGLGPRQISNAVAGINNNPAANLSVSQDNASGIWIASRTGANQLDFYRAAASIASSGASASTALLSLPMFVGGLNSAGVFSLGTTDQHSMFGTTGGLSSAAVARINPRLQTALTAIGA